MKENEKAKISEIIKNINSEISNGRKPLSTKSAKEEFDSRIARGKKLNEEIKKLKSDLIVWSKPRSLMLCLV